MAENSRSPRSGQQSRSHRTQDAILRAAQDLFAVKGVHETSVNDIAERAERSVGSLYHHFRDKENLVSAVMDRITVEVEAGLDAGLDPERWHDRGIRDIATGYLTDALALDQLQPGYKRIVSEVALTDPVTRDRHVELQKRVHEGLTQLMIDRRETIAHPRPEVAARFVADQLAAMLRTRLDPDFSPTALSSDDDETFVGEVVDSVCNYLQLKDD